MLIYFVCVKRRLDYIHTILLHTSVAFRNPETFFQTEIAHKTLFIIYRTNGAVRRLFVAIFEICGRAGNVRVLSGLVPGKMLNISLCIIGLESASGTQGDLKRDEDGS